MGLRLVELLAFTISLRWFGLYVGVETSELLMIFGFWSNSRSLQNAWGGQALISQVFKFF
jgi:hypothetical protein